MPLLLCGPCGGSRWRVHVSHGRSHSHQYQSIFRQWQVDRSLCVAQTHNLGAAGTLCTLPLCGRWRWFSNCGRVGRWSPGAWSCCPRRVINRLLCQGIHVQPARTNTMLFQVSVWLAIPSMMSLPCNVDGSSTCRGNVSVSDFREIACCLFHNGFSCDKESVQVL